MKKGIFKGTKEKMRKFFIKLKNKDTSFYIVALCVCLLSTALIWRYTVSRNNDGTDLSQKGTEEGNINASLDPDEEFNKDIMENYVGAKDEPGKKEEPKELDLKNMNVPLDGEVIKEFTLDNLLYFDAIGEWRVHKGVDIKSEKTLIVESAFAGTVEKVEASDLAGTEIIIDHGSGVRTIYNNLSSSRVKEGDKVTKGQEIGNIGKCSSIESSDGPHLHFEITVDGKNVNPLDYIN